MFTTRSRADPGRFRDWESILYTFFNWGKENVPISFFRITLLNLFFDGLFHAFMQCVLVTASPLLVEPPFLISRDRIRESFRGL